MVMHTRNLSNDARANTLKPNIATTATQGYTCNSNDKTLSAGVGHASDDF